MTDDDQTKAPDSAAKVIDGEADTANPSTSDEKQTSETPIRRLRRPISLEASMFPDFGSLEILLILVVTLLVIGPKSCPKLFAHWVYGLAV